MREIIVDNFAGGGGASTGIELAIGRSVDIGMRMLQPHELYRAQGFPEWYIIDQTIGVRSMLRTSRLRDVVMLFRRHLLRRWCVLICRSFVSRNK